MHCKHRNCFYWNINTSRLHNPDLNQNTTRLLWISSSRRWSFLGKQYSNTTMLSNYLPPQPSASLNLQHLGIWHLINPTNIHPFIFVFPYPCRFSNILFYHFTTNWHIFVLKTKISIYWCLHSQVQLIKKVAPLQNLTIQIQMISCKTELSQQGVSTL